MLIGTDYYWDIVQNKIIRGKGPTAVQSRLGYFLSGPMSNSTGYTTSASMLNILIQHKNAEYDLERFWKLESMGVTTDEYTNINNDFSETYKMTSIRGLSFNLLAKSMLTNEFCDPSSKSMLVDIDWFPAHIDDTAVFSKTSVRC
jgi:hypothetical protein